MLQTFYYNLKYSPFLTENIIIILDLFSFKTQGMYPYISRGGWKQFKEVFLNK